MKATSLGLSLLVTFGIVVGRSWGQAPLVPSLSPIENYPAPPLGELLARPPAPAPPQSKTRSFLNKCGYGCDSDLNWFGCGGIRQQNQFIFGSCRTFFGEPCVQKPGRQSMYGYTP